MLFGYCGVYSGCFLFKLSMDDVCWRLAFAWGCCRGGVAVRVQCGCATVDCLVGIVVYFVVV